MGEEKIAFSERICGLNSHHLKCSFEGILEKKHQFFFPAGPFYICTRNVYPSAPTAAPKNSWLRPDICSN